MAEWVVVVYGTHIHADTHWPIRTLCHWALAES